MMLLQPQGRLTAHPTLSALGRRYLPNAFDVLAFCLIGGDDYHPDCFGGHPQPAGELMHRRRHEFDLLLAECLLEKSSKPVLGVCGGHQLISLARGGALVQDLASEWQSTHKQASTLQHSGTERKGTPQAGTVYRHIVNVAPDSLLARLVGGKKVLTNSFHHQGVRPDRIGTGLVASAWAPDGVIEAIEGTDPGRFILGVQWHPERLAGEAPHKALFDALVKAAKSQG